MFAPLGFVPGITPAQVAALPAAAAGTRPACPTLEHYMKLGSWFAGTAAASIEHLKKLEERYPGMEHINLSTSLCTPKAVMLEQFQRVAEEVMPAFR